jgi:two-component sensor histidine kinase
MAAPLNSPDFFAKIRLGRPPAETLAIAAAWVAAGFLVRLLLMPVLGGNHAYSVFYPIVLLLAFRYGPAQAGFAAGLSGILAFWAFVTPQFQVKFDGSALAALGLFGINTCVGIYLITSLNDALRSLRADHSRLDALVDTHASLFVELQARISNHLQLIVGILAYQAKGEPDEEVALALARAGERSEALSEAHRQLSGLGDEEVEFTAFAAAIAGAMCARAGIASDDVRIVADSLKLKPQSAVSLGVAMAECLARVFQEAPPGKITVQMAATRDEVRLYVSHSTFEGGEVLLTAPRSYMFKAMVEQLGARVVPSHSREHGARLAICLANHAPHLSGTLH